MRHCLAMLFIVSGCGLCAQPDLGLNVAGALQSRAVLLAEWPLDTARKWALEVGVYYGNRADLRDRTTGAVVARDRDLGTVIDLRRYLWTDGFRPGGLFAGPWLRYNREAYDFRGNGSTVRTNTQELSLGGLVGYKSKSSARIFLEPVLGIGTVALRLVDPLGFDGEQVVPLTVDYVIRLRAGGRL